MELVFEVVGADDFFTGLVELKTQEVQVILGLDSSDVKNWKNVDLNGKSGSDAKFTPIPENTFLSSLSQNAKSVPGPIAPGFLNAPTPVSSGTPAPAASGTPDPSDVGGGN